MTFDNIILSDRDRFQYEYTLLDMLNIWLQLLTFNIFWEKRNIKSLKEREITLESKSMSHKMF